MKQSKILVVMTGLFFSNIMLGSGLSQGLLAKGFYASSSLFKTLGLTEEVRQGLLKIPRKKSGTAAHIYSKNYLEVFTVNKVERTVKDKTGNLIYPSLSIAILQITDQIREAGKSNEFKVKVRIRDEFASLKCGEPIPLEMKSLLCCNDGLLWHQDNWIGVSKHVDSLVFVLLELKNTPAHDLKIGLISNRLCPFRPKNKNAARFVPSLCAEEVQEVSSLPGKEGEGYVVDQLFRREGEENSKKLLVHSRGAFEDTFPKGNITQENKPHRVSLSLMVLGPWSPDTKPENNYNYYINLVEAVRENDLAEVKRLIKRGVLLNVETSSSDFSPLILAAEEGFIDIVEILLEAGANVDAISNCGVTALWIAAQNGYEKIVKLLLGKNPNLEAVWIEYNITALIIAAQNGHTEIVRLLLEAGAKSDAVSLDGFTAAKVADSNEHTEVVEIIKTWESSIKI